MKKIISLICILCAFNLIFAKSYEEAFEHAKNYEEQGKFVYALANYFDAMTLANNENKQNTATTDSTEIKSSEEKYKNANAKFETIASMIKEGKPGLDDYDAFELYDKWIDLLKEFEHYWTENCPLFIEFYKLRRKELNVEDRTAVYEVSFFPSKNKKYYELKEIFCEGLSKAINQNAWKTEILKNWPSYSVYNITNKKTSEDYFPENIPLIYTPFEADIYPYDVYDECRYINSKLFAPFAELHYYTYSEFRKKYETERSGMTITPYDLKFKIIDENENTIFQSKRILIKIRSYSIQSQAFTVSESQLKSIDSGNYKIIPTGLYLQYGKISDETIIEEDNRNWIKKLPELEISLENLEYKVTY